jgi:adenosylmethionine---8-amino-7-oxononanoate aminotransferase
MNSVFVTGTDTGIGKTLVAACLVRAWGMDYWKPVQTGLAEEAGDAATVRRLTGIAADRVHPSAYEFQAPLSPEAAAALEGRNVELAAFRLPASERGIVIEGAGGLLVPLDGRHLMIDLMAQLGCPVILVARSGLGTINHTLLSVEALRGRGLDMLGVVLVGDLNKSNKDAIEAHGGVPVIAELPWVETIDEAAMESLARLIPPHPALSPNRGRGLEREDGGDQTDSSLAPARGRGLRRVGQAKLSLTRSWVRGNSAELIALDRKHLWHPFTQAATAPDPIAIESASGSWLTATDGKRYLDLISSWWVTLHGHAHPAIAAAIADQAHQLEQIIFAGFTHEPAVRLATRLANALPAELDRVFFSDDGSTAVEVALKLAYQYWRNRGEPQRHRFLAFDGGYHGDTFGAMAAGYSSGFYEPFGDLLVEVEHLPYPATWDGDPNVAEKEAAALSRLDNWLERFGAETAALIVEPLVQGASGMRMCRPEFLHSLRKRLTAAGVLLIFDEVMTGFGRTGGSFACIKSGVTPDLVCLSKGLTGGFLPLSATVCGPAIYEAFLDPGFAKAFAHGHSFTANPLGCAAALASFDLFETPETASRLAMIETVHRRRLALLRDRPEFVEARCTGTIAAVNLNGDAHDYAGPASQKLQRFFLDRGLLLRPLGPVIYILPPYCTSEAELDSAYDAIEDAAEVFVRESR